MGRRYSRRQERQEGTVLLYTRVLGYALGGTVFWWLITGDTSIWGAFLFFAFIWTVVSSWLHRAA